ncbi:hypothetical protein [Octadecabacter sp. R77987]|uniref:hypothetical protein n=1 Tax=Octadecabacter sp. R77987 TaxID=3093874 RepID=UPI00367341AA
MARKIKKQSWGAGDLFVIETRDGLLRLGQVLGAEVSALNSAICAYSLKAWDPKVGKPTLDENDIISVGFATRDLLDSGGWRVVGHQNVLPFIEEFDLETRKAEGFVGTKVRGSGLVIQFLDACLGLLPWDKMFDPEYFEKLLIDPSRKPKNLIYKTNSKRH